MIQVKNSEQIALMKVAGRITGEAILAAAEHIKEGVSTLELDNIIRHYIEKSETFVSRIRRFSRKRLYKR